MRVIFRSEELLSLLRALSLGTARVSTLKEGRGPSVDVSARASLRLCLTSQRAVFSVDVPIVDSVDVPCLRLPISATRRAVELLESELVFLTQTAQGQLKLSGRFGRSCLLDSGRSLHPSLAVDPSSWPKGDGTFTIPARVLIRMIRHCARICETMPSRWAFGGVRFHLRNSVLIAKANNGRATAEAWTSQMERIVGTRPISEIQSGSISGRGLMRLARWLSERGASPVHIDLQAQCGLRVLTQEGSVAWIGQVDGRIPRPIRSSAKPSEYAEVSIDCPREFREALRRLADREPCRPIQGVQMTVMSSSIRLRGLHDFTGSDLITLPVTTKGVSREAPRILAFDPEFVLSALLHESRVFSIRIPPSPADPLCFFRSGQRLVLTQWLPSDYRHRQIRCDSCLRPPIDFIGSPPPGWEHFRPLPYDRRLEDSLTDEGRCPRCSRHDDSHHGLDRFDLGGDFFDDDFSSSES